MDLDSAIAWAADRTHGVLVTIRRDGRPQSSDITYTVDEGTFVISVTDGRAKTKNLRRDARAVLHVTEPDTWSYVSFDGMVDLSPVASSPDDATADALVEYYEAVAGKPHPDWDEYRAAMVAEHRLLATFVPATATGQTR